MGEIGNNAASDYFGKLMADPMFNMGLSLLTQWKTPYGQTPSLANALQHYNGWQQNQQLGEMKKMQMDEYKRKIEKEKRQDELTSQLAGLAKQFARPATTVTTPEQATFEQPPMLDSQGGLAELMGKAPTFGGAMTDYQPAQTTTTPAGFDYQGYMASAMPTLEQLKPGSAMEFGIRMQDKADAREQRAEELKAKLADAATARQERIDAARELAQLRIDAQKDQAELVASLRAYKQADPYFTPLQTDSGYLPFNNRTGTVSAPVVVNGKVVLPAAQSPSLQGQKAAATVSGKATGEQIGMIPAKQDALSAVDAAISILDKGIYTGAYGGLQEQATRYSGGAIGDKKKVANTQDFRSAIGETIIPRLKEFGGNDSNEELKFLTRVAGGDTSLESKAIKEMLRRAKSKITRGITRAQQGLDANGVPVSGVLPSSREPLNIPPPPGFKEN